LSEELRSAAPLVYAVVTNWNGLDDTSECIESIQRSTYPNLQVVIVDNGSTDNSASVLAERFPMAAQVRMDRNGAVTAAYNAGLRYALKQGADYVLMLNNDTILDEEMTALLVEFAQKDARFGLITPKIYYYDRPEVIWFAGGMRSRFDFGAYGTGEGETDPQENSAAKEVDYAWACGMLMSREMLESVGMFDTQFYLYYDDVDYSIRVQEAGYEVWYVPEAKMWHKVSHSTSGSADFARIWARSKMRLYRKHSRGLHRVGLVLYAFVHAAFRALLPRSDNLRISAHPCAYIRGLVDGLTPPAEVIPSDP
jgi:GT2 family glycosyltransferase